MNSRNNNGWIKLYRQLIESEIFASQIGLKIWIWCLIKAFHKKAFIPIKIGKGESIITVERGSFIFGRYTAEKELNINGSTIYKWIKKLEKMEMINIESSSHYSIITICKYDSYQRIDEQEVAAIEQPRNSHVAAIEQPRNTYNNDNNDNNDNNISIERGDWRKSFEVYKDYVRQGYQEAISDLEWMSKQQEFNPGIDIPKSIEKSCVNFWATEEGWLNKKKSKSKTINWKTTFANAISNSINKVYKNKENENEKRKYHQFT